MPSAAYLIWLRPLSPVAANGPESGSMKAMRIGSAGVALEASPASSATTTAKTSALLGLHIVGLLGAVTLHNRRRLTSGAARWAHLLRWLVARRRLASGPISPLR